MTPLNITTCGLLRQMSQPENMEYVGVCVNIVQSISTAWGRSGDSVWLTGNILKNLVRLGRFYESVSRPQIRGNLTGIHLNQQRLFTQGEDRGLRRGHVPLMLRMKERFLIFFPLSYLHFLHHLLPKRADLGGRGDIHVLRAFVLAGHTVEEAAVILQVYTEVRLEGRHTKTHCTK